MNEMKALRLIVWPFILALNLITYTFFAFKDTWLFLKHGGEWIVYRDYETKPTMKMIYEQLKNRPTV